MTTRTMSCFLAVLAVAGALAATPAQAAPSDPDTLAAASGKVTKTKAAKKTKSAKKSRSAKHIKSTSEETTAERERRLKRECKGRYNAGACLGYAN